MIPSYPYLQVLHTLKLYSQFEEEESEKLIMLVCFPCQLVFINLFDFTVVQQLNPLTPKISLVILVTVCHTVLVMLVWRIWYWINLKS